MNCDWEEFEERDARGWRRVRCKRPGCGIVTGKTPHDFDRIISLPGCRSHLARAETGRTGTELTKLLEQLGATPDDEISCGCKEIARRMDRQGIAWCKKNRSLVIDHLHKAYSKLNWSDVAAFAARAVASGLAFKIGFQDPAQWLVDEAISRAEKNS